MQPLDVYPVIVGIGRPGGGAAVAIPRLEHTNCPSGSRGDGMEVFQYIAGPV